MSKNVAMFVDVANLYYAARGQDVDVDYVALLKHATKGRDLIRAYAYTGLDPENENQRKFIDFLAKNGYKPVVKDIRKFGDGRMKANLDIELVVDLFRLADRMDIAVIVSGDGDFAPAIRALQDKGVRAEVISFKPNTSSDLIAVADEFMDIMKVASISRKEGRAIRDAGMSAPEMPAKEVTPEFGFREASPSVAAAALAALKTGTPASTGNGRRTRGTSRRTAAPAAVASATPADEPPGEKVPVATATDHRNGLHRGEPPSAPAPWWPRPRQVAPRGDAGRSDRRRGGRLGGVRRPQPARRARGRPRVHLRGGRCGHPRRARHRSGAARARRRGRPGRGRGEAEAPHALDGEGRRCGREAEVALATLYRQARRRCGGTGRGRGEAEAPHPLDDEGRRRTDEKPKSRSRRSTAKPAADAAGAEGVASASQLRGNRRRRRAPGDLGPLPIGAAVAADDDQLIQTTSRHRRAGPVGRLFAIRSSC